MIRAIAGHGGGEAAFLAAAGAQPLPGIELVSAWYAFGKGQVRGAHGWHFFTGGEAEEPFALALRGGTAWACGGHDPEELGEFLRCVGAARLTVRLSDEGAFSACPDGFAPAERMLGLLLPYQTGQDPPAAPEFPAGYRLTEEPDAGRVAGFLCGEGAFAAPDAAVSSAAEKQARQAAAQLFARELDARAAVGLGYAAFLMEQEALPGPGPGASGQAEQRAAPAAGAAGREKGRIAAAMTVTTAVFAKAVCLSAIQLRADLRGRGLGSRMVRALAAGAGRYARDVCLLCRPERAGFYARLGFVPEGEYACFVPAR